MKHLLLLSTFIHSDLGHVHVNVSEMNCVPRCDDELDWGGQEGNPRNKTFAVQEHIAKGCRKQAKSQPTKAS
jgi:hypothetical protein